MSDKYIIVWTNHKTGATGKSQNPQSKKVAEAWCDDMNNRYPEIKHEIKKVQP